MFRDSRPFVGVQHHICKLASEKGVPLKTVFASLDTNRDGYLSRKELQEGLRRVGIELSLQQTARLMQMLDLNDDGGIVSCGTRARVFVGLAMVRQASGVPVEIGGGLVRVEQTEDDDFAGRSLR